MRTHRKWLAAMASAAGIVSALPALSQADVQINGSVNISSVGPGGAGSGQLTFACTGTNPCAGTYSFAYHDAGCSNSFLLADAIVVSGLDLSAPGPISGTVSVRNADFDDRLNPDGSCTITSRVDFVQPFTGSWDGSYATLVFAPVTTPSGDHISLTGSITTKAASGTLVSGTFANDPAAPDIVQGSFDCKGAPTCAGQYRLMNKVTECSNALYFSGPITITGLSLDQSGPLQGSMVVGNADHNFQRAADGSCTAVPGSDFIGNYTGNWDRAAGTGSFTLVGNNGQGGQDVTLGSFKANVAVPAPVFPMAVTSNITSDTATVSAVIQYRPQDLNTTGSVYVFGYAPASLVKSYDASKAWPAGGIVRAKAGTKDTPVACVLAQLNSSGQLVQVTPSTLQAYVSGVLTAQGQAVSILNGVPTAAIAGTTFYVGYGASGTAMFNGGINRSAATIPGSQVCQPQAPQTGWWWNPTEGGRGFSVEVQGNHIFFAGFLYDASGRSTWYVATGPVSLDASVYNGDLLSSSGGQTLSGAYRRNTIKTEGSITLAFSDATHGTIVWPGGVVPIERFDIVPNGLKAPAPAGQPENGWWWNPAESGRGFFIEWQNGWVDLAGYMYDDAGNPVWYLSVYETPDPKVLNGSWWSYANGQTLMGAYKPATRINNNVAPVTIQFQDAENAIITLPGGKQTPLTRQRY